MYECVLILNANGVYVVKVVLLKKLIKKKYFA